jgi:hypothetical protein
MVISLAVPLVFVVVAKDAVRLETREGERERPVRISDVKLK